MSLSLSHRGAVSSVDSAGCCGTVPLTGAVGGRGTVGGKFWSNGSYFNQFPADCVKEWSEIEEGRDFFDAEGKVDVILKKKLKQGNQAVSIDNN